MKDLDKIEKDKNKVFQKYKFPVKKFKKEDKKYDPIKILERVNKDRELFADFLEGFSDEAKEPFSKHFNQTLGQNFINTFNILYNITNSNLMINDFAFNIIKHFY